MVESDGKNSRHTVFDVIQVLGGGTFEVESDAEGLFISCNELIINSGGKLRASKLVLEAKTVRIDQSGILDTNSKVLILPILNLIKVLILPILNLIKVLILLIVPVLNLTCLKSYLS